MAEVMAYLNGCNLPRIFNIRTLLVKFVSCACAVGSGLPVRPCTSPVLAKLRCHCKPAKAKQADFNTHKVQAALCTAICRNSLSRRGILDP